jgi:SAM-dependent methyltransferase
MNSNFENPWLNIPSEDYEAHMSMPSVGQLQMLDKIFESVLDEFTPTSIAVLGCTAGNGFQHLINLPLERVVGIDINFNFLDECRAWFIQDVENLHLVCADLNKLELADSTFDLIHAALIFEYVDVDELLSKISRWLRADGILSVVLQIENETVKPVSETPYQSLKKLEPFMKLIDPAWFVVRAEIFGLNEESRREIKLPGGKEFIEIIFKK